MIVKGMSRHTCLSTGVTIIIIVSILALTLLLLPFLELVVVPLFVASVMVMIGLAGWGRQIQKSLRESEIKYRTLFESMDEGFCICEMLFDQQGIPYDYQFLDINPIFASITGLTDALNKTALELVPNLEAVWFETYGRVVKTREPVRFESHSTAMNRWFDVNAFPVGDPHRNQFAILFTNISDRKRTEIALQDSEKQFRHMADNAPFMVWVTDLAAHCTYLSQSWYDLTGQTLETGLGMGWLKQIHPEDREQAEQAFLAAHKRQEAFQIEYRLRRQDGEYIWAIDAASPWWSGDSCFKGYVGSVIDISDRKRAEQAQAQLLVLEQAAREAAERANRIKDEFLTVLSHELRSPLTPILGWSKVLQSDDLDEATTVQALSTIERNAKLQAKLIEDLLDISRILQGKLRLNPSLVNLVNIIQDAIETVHLSAEAKSISVTVTQTAGIIEVLGDAMRLQQVVWNLLSNAIKFTPSGGQVSVQVEQGQNAVQMIVNDTGPGISSDFLPHVFEYFRQADSKKTRKFGGLGLGLAIVRYLIELHGGSVEAASDGEGLGATFTVTLPISSHHLRDYSDSSGEGRLTDLEGIHILVIDDELDSRFFLSFVLEEAGARVTTAATAGRGFSMLTQSPPDVLLCDIGMPDMNGYKLIQQIRKMPAHQGGQVKAIALTTVIVEPEQQRAITAGFQTYLSKPIPPDTLIAAIVSVIHSPLY
jgi:PAS domain S-box-containing protein